MVALSANAVLSSLRLVPVAVLQRDLRFRGLALVDAAQALVSTVATLALALAGWRYWALVVGGILGNVAAAVASRWLAPRGFARPRWGTLGRYYRFTRDVLVGRIAWFVYSNADFIVAGRALGTATLGAYSFAWNIASVPVEKITALVTRVTPGFFSKLKDDRAELSRMLVNVTEGLVLLTLPTGVGMALVADDFVAVYLGPQWTEAVVPLQILALNAAFRSVVTLLPQVLTMLGDTRFLRRHGIFCAIVLPAGFAFGSRWGAAGIAAVWGALYPVVVVPLYIRTFRALGLSIAQYLASLWITLRGVIAMTAAVVAVRYALPGEWSEAARLAVQVVAGGLAFLVAGVLPNRVRLKQVARLVKAPAAPPVPAP
jgi:PST family polysaccharide transporter